MSILWFAFLTGLTTGGFSCLAVQGGLLASAVSDGGMGFKKQLPLVGMFVAAKLFAYTLLGFVLGWAGSSLTLAPKTLGYVQIVAGLFMLATALRIADAHPVFRYFVITPPRWAFKLLRKTSRNESLFAPAILGFLTILMPCGVTQATMMLAVASGSPLSGAAIMFAFILGTSPIFFALGATVVELLQKRVFAYAAAGIVGIFALLSINGGVRLTGSPYTLANFYRAAITPIDQLARGGVYAAESNGMQQVIIDVDSRGYTASAQLLRRSIPVQLTLRTNNTQGCARAFTIPDLNIAKVLPPTGEQTITFTPMRTGFLVYSCSMGMYTGSFEVVD